MLAVRCQFLQGTYQASPPGAPGVAEWPPHPGRLHAALVAAAWALGGDEIDEGDLQALRWLEEQDPPGIACTSHAVERSAPIVYVPRNLSRAEVTDAHGRIRRGEGVGRQIGRTDRRFPTMVVGDDPVWFVWPNAKPSEEVRERLRRLVEAVQYLGSSRSPVACSLAEASPQATHRPGAGGHTAALRTAGRGMTDQLIAHRESEAPPGLGSTVVYGDEPVESEPATVPGAFGPLVVLRRVAGFPLGIQHAGLIAERFRSAVLSRAGDEAPSILHGHGRNPHVAYLALPNVGHPYSEGAIMGVAAAVPADCTDDELREVVAAASGVNRLAIHSGVVPWRLEPVRGDGPRALDPATWIGPSRAWATATPVLLDRHPKPNRGETLEDVVRRSLEHVDLPGELVADARIEISKAPFLHGAVPAGLHPAPSNRKAAGFHLRVEFGQEVRGPLLVGRGRYLGIGLMKPIRPGLQRGWRQAMAKEAAP